ncbi:Hypothetical predicted protein, partial [Olea europaea subsp. europaea]
IFLDFLNPPTISRTAFFQRSVLSGYLDECRVLQFKGCAGFGLKRNRFDLLMETCKTLIPCQLEAWSAEYKARKVATQYKNRIRWKGSMFRKCEHLFYTLNLSENSQAKAYFYNRIGLDTRN